MEWLEGRKVMTRKYPVITMAAIFSAAMIGMFWLCATAVRLADFYRLMYAEFGMNGVLSTAVYTNPCYYSSFLPIKNYVDFLKCVILLCLCNAIALIPGILVFRRFKNAWLSALVAALVFGAIFIVGLWPQQYSWRYPTSAIAYTGPTTEFLIVLLSCWVALNWYSKRCS